MPNKYIDAAEFDRELCALMRKYNRDCEIERADGVFAALARLRLFPSTDVAPVVHGRWIHDRNNLYGCNNCLYRETMSHKEKKKYCPNCGAIMDLEN